VLCRVSRPCVLVLALALLLPIPGAVGQQAEIASRGPRFLRATWGAGLELDASGSEVLRRRVSLDLSGVTLDRALKEITRQASLEISYSPRVVAVDRLVTVQARDITVAAALTELLLDTPVDVSVTPGGQLALVRRVYLPPPAVDTGAVAGRVTDGASGTPIAGATVTVEGVRSSEVTGDDGRYRVGGLTAGSYTLWARYIGYTPASASVTIKAGEEAVADFALTKSAQELDQVVVTGTIVPTEVKAVPTPVSVIDESEIAQQRPRTVAQLFRQAIPSAVSWDFANAPYSTPFSVRGSTNLAGAGAQTKVFIDGIETASPTLSALDPTSVERIEVIRGPQAAAIYGSDAIGGVVQIFTKRGDPSLSGAQVNAEAALGLIQTPYDGYGGVVRHSYSASVRGRSSNVGYSFGMSYSHTGDWLPGGAQSAQSIPGLYTAIQYARGILTLDLSGRYYTENVPNATNPAFFETGVPFFAKPFFQSQQFQNLTVGVRLGLAPTSWWQHTVTAGVDRSTQDLVQTQPRLTSAGDTLLTVLNSSGTKASIGYNTSVHGALAEGVSGSLTAGFDHYGLPVNQFSTSSALNTVGTIEVSAGQPISVSRIVTHNTGYFAQAQLGFRGALFLTGGLRAEQNSGFGDSLGTPVSPRVGLSYAQSMGRTTFKLRGSWGRAIRAPSPGLKAARLSAFDATLANPVLGPERQQGWDAGMDAAFGEGASLSVTYYHQRAEGLIDRVLIQAQPVLTYQYQNVGSVKNTGVEVEGMLALRPVTLRAQYAYTRSRVEQLAPNYLGNLQVGDQALQTPKHTAGGSIALSPFRGTNVAAGLVYVGSWNATDFVGWVRCLGGTGPCRNTTFALDRAYVVAYPAFAKVTLNITQELTSRFSAFVALDNLTNNDAYELVNTNPVMGRITTVGLRLQR
jgi:outer membrane receptor protein involved in Fe transport